MKLIGLILTRRPRRVDLKTENATGASRLQEDSESVGLGSVPFKNLVDKREALCTIGATHRAASVESSESKNVCPLRKRLKRKAKQVEAVATDGLPHLFNKSL